MPNYYLVDSWQDPKDDTVKQQAMTRAIAALEGAAAAIHHEGQMLVQRRLDEVLPLVAKDIEKQASTYGIDLTLGIEKETDVYGHIHRRYHSKMTLGKE